MINIKITTFCNAVDDKVTMEVEVIGDSIAEVKEAYRELGEIIKEKIGNKKGG